MQTPTEVVQAWVDAFNASDVGALATLYTEDATNHQVVQEPISRTRATAGTTAQVFHALGSAMSD
jgi:ketosteroid isomerase-like protein